MIILLIDFIYLSKYNNSYGYIKTLCLWDRKFWTIYFLEVAEIRTLAVVRAKVQSLAVWTVFFPEGSSI